MRIKVTFRIGGTEKNILTDGFRMPDTYRTEKKEFDCNSVEELFSMFPPVNPSENLKKAAKEFIAGKRNSLTYNFGKGNSTFYLI